MLMPPLPQKPTSSLWAQIVFKVKTRKIEVSGAARFFGFVLPDGVLESERNIASLIRKLSAQGAQNIRSRVRAAFLLILSNRPTEAAPLLKGGTKPAQDEIIRLLKALQKIAPAQAVALVGVLRTLLPPDALEGIVDVLCQKAQAFRADAAIFLLTGYHELVPTNAKAALGLEKLLPTSVPLQSRLALFRQPLERVPDTIAILQRLRVLLADDPATLASYIEPVKAKAAGNLVLADIVVRSLLTQHQLDEALTIASDALDRAQTIVPSIAVLLRILSTNGRYDAMARTIDRLLPQDSQKLLLPYQADLLAANGDPAAALALVEARLAEIPDSHRQKMALTQHQSRYRLLVETAAIFARVPQPQHPIGIAVMMMGYSPLALLWHSLVAIEMRKHGYATILLDSHTGLTMAPTGIAEIDSLNGLLTHQGRYLRGREGNKAWQAAWTVDVDKKQITTAGINVYQPIYERVGTQQRRYSVDMHSPQTQGSLDYQIGLADTALAACQTIEAVAAAQNLSVRFLGIMSHYVPAAVYRKYCAAHPGSRMEFISFLAAYQHYYNNLANTVSTALSVENMTRHPELRMPCHAYPEQFDAWIARQDDIDGIVAEVDKIINQDRARKESSPEAEAVMQRILAHRAKGGRVVCLFGKIMYDICVEEEGGPAHTDMIDWLNHSIDAVRGHDDVLLLIKPHPNEIKPMVASPTEFFFDGIHVPLPDNVIKLEHRWFNINDILPVIDMGTIWHGTATLELMSRGIPLTVCATWGVKDHPVEVVSAPDRATYEDVLRHPERQSVSADQRRRAALLINYLASDEIIVPYDYGHMPVFRNVGASFGWYVDKVDTYLRDGDPYIAQIAARCL